MVELPQHIAIIMDGNGRWAKKKFMPKALGHRRGAETLKQLCKYADKLGLKHMTVYAFSTENWKRSVEEVSALMGLLKEYVGMYIRDNENTNIKMDFIGDRENIPQDLREKMEELEEASSDKTGLQLHIALNYGSRDEIKRAVQKIAKRVKTGEISADDINEEMISDNLDTKGIPDPELLIRTSGELRLSNYLMWQLAYTEFYFCDKLWPDFNIDDLVEAVEVFRGRDRRFGGRNEVK